MFIDGTQKLSLIARSGVYDLAEPAQHLYQSCDSRSRPRFGNAFKAWLSCIYAAFRHLLLVKCRIDALEKYFLRA